jgi:hypothetical protein
MTSSSTLPRSRRSTSAPLFTVPTRRVPRRARARSLVGNARIQVSRRSPQLHRHSDKAAGAPIADALGGQRSSDSDQNAARHSRPIPIQALDVHTERDTTGRQRRIRAEPSAHHGKRLVIERKPPARRFSLLPLFARERLERRPQGRRHARCHASVGEERAPCEELPTRRRSSERRRRPRAMRTTRARRRRSGSAEEKTRNCQGRTDRRRRLK